MNPYRWLLLCQFGPMMCFVTLVPLLFTIHEGLAIGVFLSFTLLCGFAVSKIRCPNCGNFPTRRQHPDIPFTISAPVLRDTCPHCHAPLSHPLPPSDS